MKILFCEAHSWDQPSQLSWMFMVVNPWEPAMITWDQAALPVASQQTLLTSCCEERPRPCHLPHTLPLTYAYLSSTPSLQVFGRYKCEPAPATGTVCIHVEMCSVLRNSFDRCRTIVSGDDQPCIERMTHGEGEKTSTGFTCGRRVAGCSPEGCACRFGSESRVSARGWRW